MFVAREKYNENIAEYILYMWQIEDLIRSFHLNGDDIFYNVIEPAVSDEKTARQVRNWYEGLIEKMKIQGIEESGHLHELRETVADLQEIHDALLEKNDPRYVVAFTEAEPFLTEFMQRSRTDSGRMIEVALNALYMKLLLRLQNKPISQESDTAFRSFSKIVSMLVWHYHHIKKNNPGILYN